MLNTLVTYTVDCIGIHKDYRHHFFFIFTMLHIERKPYFIILYRQYFENVPPKYNIIKVREVTDQHNIIIC